MENAQKLAKSFLPQIPLSTTALKKQEKNGSKLCFNLYRCNVAAIDANPVQITFKKTPWRKVSFFFLA